MTKINEITCFHCNQYGFDISLVSHRDALRAKRAQEQAEREWRKKEAEEARKKADTESMLISARKNQMQQKEHYLAVQAQRERNEFERVLR